ncbi:MAG TPA: NUDIX domain-containing protein, partial [Candidatus Saccharimonadales bacterium]|nr:NUDIX domain-containing protein [Candidatus Saccharimonadales bacterium]
KKVVPKDAVLIPSAAQKVFTGVIFDVYQWPQKMFDGTTATFEMLKRPDTVTVIPVLSDKIITIEDEQPHSGARLSFPGGRVDKNERTLDAAKREIKEETGHEFKSWRLIKVWQPHTKLEWFIYFYVAWDGLKRTDSRLDSGEKIKLKKVNFSEAKNFIVTKAGYLEESKEIFDKVNSIDELVNLPEYSGQELER